MEDQQKATTENAPQRDEQELKNEELDELAGGNNGGSTAGPAPPHH